ncbi:hypothetical protein GXY_16147 [Novacetimonas hansenii ATCC 23769]|uniref:Uncharacterized protein n=1 Tax=Novacetimonas hansenii ATCC 23769 TaxID=714995 RepID=D5QJ96_NOVHA|nr:hypothetical protein GXY_16147 [Novacetimonas hansenii ATCC 23769]PYD73115.1 hypothetical protein CFR74_06420 [Novacetimonas hansenii]
MGASHIELSLLNFAGPAYGPAYFFQKPTGTCRITQALSKVHNVLEARARDFRCFITGSFQTSPSSCPQQARWQQVRKTRHEGIHDGLFRHLVNSIGGDAVTCVA